MTRRPWLIASCLLLTSIEAWTATVPEGLQSAVFAGPDIVPSPACLCAAPTGEVFVGVDENGSLGKKPGKGRIVRLIDDDHDGKADRHTIFARVDNPRGLIALGHRLFVLHTVIPADTGVLTGMHLSVFTDADQDGVADGPPTRLVSDVSVPKHNQDRGADHTTNGIVMGIDGWIYIAVGDFGMVDARGSDGTLLTMLGGGIVRVRPDGTEMEIYTHGTRNIYDLAIDPFLNIYTRGNTNDGGGWNVRFLHHVQSAEYGYPTRFKHFTGEILPALADLGGGSGTGALYFDEPGWPEPYTGVPLMADWGRSQLVLHRLTPDGASFQQQPESFIRSSQIADLDGDGSGRLYLAAWDGAGYKGSSEKGFVDRVVPEGWKYQPFPDLHALDNAELVTLLREPSAVMRLHAQQTLVQRKAPIVPVLDLAWDETASKESRVAAVFTAKQLGADTSQLVQFAAHPAMRAFALRAMTDRLSQMDDVPVGLIRQSLRDRDPRVQAAAAIALGRLGDPSAAEALLAIAHPPTGTFKPQPDASEGPHAVPHAALVVPHLAIQALTKIGHHEASLKALTGPHRSAALWALQYAHDSEAIESLIAHLSEETDSVRRLEILALLARLYHREAPYDGSWWWGTRPDTRGPYYKLAKWEKSGAIHEALLAAMATGDQTTKQALIFWNERLRLNIDALKAPETERAEATEGEPKVDLTKIANKPGEVGKTSIEDVMLALDTLKGDPKRGEALFVQQGCLACHTTSSDQPLKGPYMGQVGAILSPEQIAESILKPNASISQGFATVQIDPVEGASLVGFVTAETADAIELRDIGGQVHKVKANQVKARQELEMSMMPAGLANALSLQDFASLIAYLAGLKKG